MTEYTILGIDPGSNDLGLCFTKVEIETGRILNMFTYSLDVNSLTMGDYYYDGDPRLTKLLALEQYMTKVFTEVNPNALAMEAPFFNRFSPVAYGVLTEIVSLIKMVAAKTNPMINIMIIEPLLVKKYVKSNYKEGKEGIKKAVEGNPLLSVFLSPTATEHEIDAMAIAYSFYLNMFPG